MPHTLAGQTALITGAGSGIGRAAAILLARHGLHLTLAGRHLESLAATASHFPPAGPPPQILSVNLADPRQARAMIDDALAHHGRLDILINNAGEAISKPIAQHDDAALHRAFTVNFFGPAAAISRAWPAFERQHSGCIINVSSMSAIDPFTGLAIYGAAKAALNTLTKGCATEGAAFGLRAFAIAPGAVETPMLRRLFPESALPPSRTLSPEAIAELILACIRGDHDARNGETIPLPSP
ncbi:MAG: SDR family oxidoreductase [Phycisphaerales bacterium]|nr:SDR family oxidoreductase [Phycisphaerales bacterium]